MSYRTVVISNASYLNISKLQLQITQGDNVFTVPLQDIACIIFNHYQISLSANLLSGCADNNIVLIACDDKHLPNGIFHSYLPHSRQNLVLQKQLNLTKAFKKRIWQDIIQSKIINQARMSPNLFETSNQLLILASKVSSGDKENREAQASRLYFSALFGDEFIRLDKFKLNAMNSTDNDKINILLNYSYTIVRSLIIRSIIGYGLLPTLGLFHNNQLNAFNLADDFIEPFRAYIDWYVCSIGQTESELNTANKVKLIDLLNYLVIIDNKNTSILNAVDIMIKSFITCMNNNDYSLLLKPNIPLELNRSNID